MGMHPELWAIVLAGGDGTRLAGLTVTRPLYGQARPKQYAVLFGERSLLQITLTRIAALVPARRTIVVATRGQELLARRPRREGRRLARGAGDLRRGPEHLC